MHFYLKNYDKALADIAKAVELKADDCSNLFWIPRTWRSARTNVYAKGSELADKTIEMTKGVVDYMVGARLYAVFGQPERATADFR